MIKISELSGIGEKRTAALESAGICTLTDLLNHFPRDYDDRSQVKQLSELIPQTVNTIRGVVAYEPEAVSLSRRGQKGARLDLVKVIIKDHTGMLELVWFNQPYLKKNFKKGSEYIFTGMIRETGGRMQMQSPDYEPAGDLELSSGRIVPIYTLPKSFYRLFSQKTFRQLIYQALEMVSDHSSAFPEYLTDDFRREHNLCGREAAVRNIHFPESDELFMVARRRLVFEELFFMQLALLHIKGAATTRQGIPLQDVDYAPFLRVLPFALTKAQVHVLEEITRDMSGGFSMNRLVQGDVGSGKTAVAMAAAYLAVKNGYQVALMAPTDVLANQHYASCGELFAGLGFDTVLLTGGLRVKPRREALAKISDGRAVLIIGTHALIQEGVSYHRLGLCITDEQHRFGVIQRLALSQKGEMPHTLVMTATPIPRTLGMILYGDMDISIIDTLPPGRQPVKTYCVGSSYRQRLLDFIRKETAKGGQVYVICPAIEESEERSATSLKAELTNVLAYTNGLIAALPELTIACLHGRMAPADKQQIMDNFKEGQTQVLVSTTVIEVGVHVANANLMIIENAERFGLSQLHQLRGRVGRGKTQAHCVLITDTKNPQTRTRMKAMTDTNDGFKLAEIDLKERGTGDFFGTRQHGLPEFLIANLYRDMDVLKEVQEAVAGIDLDVEQEVAPGVKRYLEGRVFDIRFQL